MNFYYFEIVNNGETVTVSNEEIGKGTFINSPQKGEIKIIKTSYDNEVEGIKFKVTGTEFVGNKPYEQTFVTDENGDVITVRPETEIVFLTDSFGNTIVDADGNVAGGPVYYIKKAFSFQGRIWEKSVKIAGFRPLFIMPR